MVMEHTAAAIRALHSDLDSLRYLGSPTTAVREVLAVCEAGAESGTVDVDEVLAALRLGLERKASNPEGR